MSPLPCSSAPLAAHRSNYHVELNPSDVGNNDRYVVQEVIKELARNRPLDVAGALQLAACMQPLGLQQCCSYGTFCTQMMTGRASQAVNSAESP
jgi:DNA polymerase III delta prime subunit